MLQELYPDPSNNPVKVLYCRCCPYNIHLHAKRLKRAISFVECLESIKISKEICSE